MTTLADLKDWIEGDRNYHAGCALYRFYGTNEVLKQLFTRGNPNAFLGMLVNELRAIYQAKAAVLPDPVQFESKIKAKPKVVVSQEEFKVFSETKKPTIVFDELPIELKKIFIEKSELWKQADYHRNRLDTLISDEDRLKSAQLIISNMDRVQEIWQQLDAWYYQQTAPKPAPIKLDLVQSIHLRNNIRCKISRAKKANKTVLLETLRSELSQVESAIATLSKEVSNGVV